MDKWGCHMARRGYQPTYQVPLALRVGYNRSRQLPLDGVPVGPVCGYLELYRRYLGSR